MEQFIPWAIFCLSVLVLCLARPGAGRIFVGIFFLVMAIGVNIVLVLRAPDQFVALGADSFVPLYRWGFRTVVAVAPPAFGLLAAAYEITVGLLSISRGQAARWGLVGGIIFLIGITPLGIWTLANPIMAVALATLLTKEHNRGAWEMLLSASAQRRRPAT